MQQQQQQPPQPPTVQLTPSAPNQQPLPPSAQPTPPAPHQQQQRPLPFRFLPTRPTVWDPASASVTLNVRLDGCIVPSEASPEGARVAHSSLVVLDDFIDEPTRQELLDFLTAPPSPCLEGGAAWEGAAAGEGEAGAEGAAPEAVAVAAAAGEPAAGGPAVGGPAGGDHHHQYLQLPPAKWERRTTDMAGAAPSWGVRQHVLEQLAAMELPAMREVHARLAKLLPDFKIALLPSEAIQAGGGAGRGRDGGGGSNGVQGPGSTPWEQQEQVQQGEDDAEDAAPPRPRPKVDCAAFVANAAVEGDSFAWHVDADPTSFPEPSPWLDAYGDYFNGEPGKPLLASLMLYLNPEWRREWGGETLFLDAATDSGVFVRPRPRRAVLFHQDTLHRVSPPSAAAAGRPRFSLVWKLVLLPQPGGGGSGGVGPGGGGREGGGGMDIARPEWGPPAAFGSAARVEAVVRQLAGEARRKRPRPAEEGEQQQEQKQG